MGDYLGGLLTGIVNIHLSQQTQSLQPLARGSYYDVVCTHGNILFEMTNFIHLNIILLINLVYICRLNI